MIVKLTCTLTLPSPSQRIRALSSFMRKSDFQAQLCKFYLPTVWDQVKRTDQPTGQYKINPNPNPNTKYVLIYYAKFSTICSVLDMTYFPFAPRCVCVCVCSVLSRLFLKGTQPFLLP